jgi:hypothetical protein
MAFENEWVSDGRARLNLEIKIFSERWTIKMNKISEEDLKIYNAPVGPHLDIFQTASPFTCDFFLRH